MYDGVAIDIDEVPGALQLFDVWPAANAAGYNQHKNYKKLWLKCLPQWVPSLGTSNCAGYPLND